MIGNVPYFRFRRQFLTLHFFQFQFTVIRQDERPLLSIPSTYIPYPLFKHKATFSKFFTPHAPIVPHENPATRNCTIALFWNVVPFFFVIYPSQPMLSFLNRVIFWYPTFLYFRAGFLIYFCVLFCFFYFSVFLSLCVGFLYFFLFRKFTRYFGESYPPPLGKKGPQTQLSTPLLQLTTGLVKRFDACCVAATPTSRPQRWIGINGWGWSRGEWGAGCGKRNWDAIRKKLDSCCLFSISGSNSLLCPYFFPQVRGLFPLGAFHHPWEKGYPRILLAPAKSWILFFNFIFVTKILRSLRPHLLLPTLWFYS